MTTPRSRKPSKRRTRATPVVPAVPAPANVVPMRAGRYRDHPHPTAGADLADLKRYPTRYDGSTLDEQAIRTLEQDQHRRARARHLAGKLLHKGALARTLALVPVEMVRSEDEIYDEQMAEHGRTAFAAMRAHQEMAAVILAAGGTIAEASEYAGVAPLTVSKYLAEPDFFARVREVRSIVLSQVQGRVLSEIHRRATSASVVGMDLKDLMALSRMTGDMAGGGSQSGAGSVAQAGGGGTGSGHNAGGAQVNLYQQVLGVVGPPGALAGVTRETIGPASAVRAVGPGHEPAAGNGSVDPGRDSGDARADVDAGAEGDDFPVFGLERDTVAEELPPL